MGDSLDDEVDDEDEGMGEDEVEDEDEGMVEDEGMEELSWVSNNDESLNSGSCCQNAICASLFNGGKGDFKKD